MFVPLDVVERKISCFGIFKIKPEDFVDRVEGNLVPWNFVFAEESGFKGFGTGIGFGAFHGSKENHMRLASMR